MDAEQLEGRARVVFLIRVPSENTAAFLEAYQRIRHDVAEGVEGHIVDQVGQSAQDPEQWVITSEWRSLADFEAWERSDDHRTLVAPLRECFTEARSLRFVIHAETRRGMASDALTTSAETVGGAPTPTGGTHSG